jgi:hypothetical protein
MNALKRMKKQKCEEESLFLKAKGKWKFVGNQCLFQVGNEEGEENYEAGESANIGGPFYDDPFEAIFEMDPNINYPRLKSFINSMYCPKGGKVKIERVELIRENCRQNKRERGLGEPYFDMACRYFIEGKHGKQEQSFNVEMQNKVLRDHSQRFLGYGTILKGINTAVPVKMLAFFSKKNSDQHVAWTLHQDRLISNDVWFAFCSLRSNIDVQGNIILKERPILQKILEDVFDLNEIDLKDQVIQVSENEPIVIKDREIDVAGKEWLKLFRILHWVQIEEDRHFQVPTGNGIVTPEIREAINVLKNIKDKTYNAGRERFKRQWDDLEREHEQGYIEGLIEGEKIGKLKNLLQGYIQIGQIFGFLANEITPHSLTEDLIRQVWEDVNEEIGEIGKEEKYEDFFQELKSWKLIQS